MKEEELIKETKSDIILKKKIKKKKKRIKK